jgi:hypothetical protein
MGLKKSEQVPGIRFEWFLVRHPSQLCGDAEWCDFGDFLTLGLSEFIRRLHIKPEAGVRSQGRGQAQRHLRGYARAAIENFGKRHARDVKMLRDMRNVHPFQVFLKDLAGVRRIVHFRGHNVSLVVIAVIEQNGIFAFKGEG